MTGLETSSMVHVRRGALLHDIGKIGIPDYILHKPEPLSGKEWEIMKMHPVYAYEMLSPISFLNQAINIPYCHHEKWDGSGYPRGLKGEQIPLDARLFSIVDIWDALSSDRPYRAAWPKDKILAHIQSLSGSHFDPGLTKLFMKMDL
ncbi:MAG: HD domain-containing protein [Nitrospirae bacterium]|nr:HD domain-containing protein [Nitrospirota bacterium]